MKKFSLKQIKNKIDSDDNELIEKVFLLANGMIDAFLGQSSFKTWVFSIATNLARNVLKKQNRWVENAYKQALEIATSWRENGGKYPSRT